jgi:hypothetical protein
LPPNLLTPNSIFFPLPSGRRKGSKKRRQGISKKRERGRLAIELVDTTPQQIPAGDNKDKSHPISRL